MLKTMLLLTLPLAVTLISGNTPTPTPTPTPQPQNLPPDGALVRIVQSNGTIDRTAYQKVAQLWGPISIGERLGPTFAQLNPGAADDRPTLFKPPSMDCKALSFANRTNPYELGKDGCKADNDYWSDSGQVGYVPDDPANDPGLDRIQTFAYYNYVFALSPRLDYASGTPHPDPQTRENYYKTMLGHFPQHPVAMVRNYSMQQNEALVVYREGLLAVAGTQTSRTGNERPYPGLLLPSNKVPTALAVTTNNEFALITVWDTDAAKGQLAVVALEGKYLPFHTWPYMAMPNQGSFSDFKLLGYIDLPFATPTAVAAACNGWWGGPSQAGGKVLSQVDLTQEGYRKAAYGGDFGLTLIVATKGYAVVASRSENKVALVDMSPLFNYVRDSYLSSTESFLATTQNRGSGAGQWPATFTEKPEIKPTVVWTKDYTAPSAVLAGHHTDRWSIDRYKAHIATEDGTIHIIDTTQLMNRWSWEPSGALAEIGSFKVGRNPVSMCFARFGESGLPNAPTKSNGAPASPDPQNNMFYVACRGDREVVGAVTWNGTGSVFRRIKDSRMGDPVAVSVATRGNIVTVADYEGKKLLSFRIGSIVDRAGTVYGAGADGKAPFELGGEMSVNGKPFLVGSSNVN
ncbi:hypothetical protein DB347_18710 [Opitutaceae bacterium EW11]|nr:hypothetical protein DB347_18710 [Opitutaceae bacterium EW11]